MRILALDAAAQSCSVAITDAGTLQAEVTLNTRMSHTRHIMELVQTAIHWSDGDIEHIQGFAVTRGPGSFTGLRIAVSTIKGLAAATQKPIVGVSSLHVLARQAHSDGRLICPLIDARKGEVYCAVYRWEKGRLAEVRRADVLKPDQALARIDGPCVFIGSGAILYERMIAEKTGQSGAFSLAGQHFIKASTIADLALSRFEAGDVDDVRHLAPWYIRKSDAELNKN